MVKLLYRPDLKGLARQLRKQGVFSEVLVWDRLKGRKMRGYQFTRQKPIGDYIVDFYCGKFKLVIEIDGDSHSGRFDCDSKRQRFLESIGLTVLRFHDSEVKSDMANVLMAIEGWIEGRDRKQRNQPI